MGFPAEENNWILKLDTEYSAFKCPTWKASANDVVKKSTCATYKLHFPVSPKS